MLIIGCDFHPGFQQVAIFDNRTGEIEKSGCSTGKRRSRFTSRCRSSRCEAMRLMTHPGVGPVTALAMVLTLGPAEQFGSAKPVGSYFGLIPSEESSGGKQRLGRISQQGSSFLRFLLVEAGQERLDPQLKRFYKRLAMRTNRSIAKVAGARKLATRLYLMLREDWTYAQLSQAVMQVSPNHPVVEQNKPTV